MTTTNVFHRWRRFAGILEAVLVVGLPFVTIDNESALRFDIPSLRLHFFGTSIWMEDFFIVVVSIIFISFLIIFITLMLGRVWCGWMCPQTVISDFTVFFDRMTARGSVKTVSAYLIILIISVAIAANLIWYFVSPYEFFIDLVSGSQGRIVSWFWAVLTLIIFLNFTLVRHKFCATVCPYAKLQSTLYDRKTLVIAFDPHRKDECMNCMACVRHCPVGIDIREGLSDACINCAQCIDACAGMMQMRQKPSLISYFFGLPGESGRILRQNAILLGSVTFAFFVFLVYLSVVRTPLDLTILPNNGFPPRITSNGTVINSYILSVKNKGKTNLNLEVGLADNNQHVDIKPDRNISISAGDMIRLPIYVTMKNSKGLDGVIDLDISIKSYDDAELTVTKTAGFIVPADRPDFHY